MFGKHCSLGLSLGISILIGSSCTYSVPKYQSTGLRPLPSEGSIDARTRSFFATSEVLDEIEGGWSFMDGRFQIAIVSTEGMANPTSDYVGVIISADRPSDVDVLSWSWKPGDIQLELNKTRYPNVFTGTVRSEIVRDPNDATFELRADGNVFDVSWRYTGFSSRTGATAIRTFP